MVRPFRTDAWLKASPASQRNGRHADGRGIWCGWIASSHDTDAVGFVTIRRRQAQGLEDRPRTALRMSALLGTAFSLGFVALLLIPGMPGRLNIQSYLMLVVWIVLGALFFVFHGKKRVAQ